MRLMEDWKEGGDRDGKGKRKGSGGGRVLGRRGEENDWKGKKEENIGEEEMRTEEEYSI